MPLFARTKPAAWRRMCGCTLKPILAFMPARSISLARPQTVNGAPLAAPEKMRRLQRSIHSGLLGRQVSRPSAWRTEPAVRRHSGSASTCAGVSRSALSLLRLTTGASQPIRQPRVPCKALSPASCAVAVAAVKMLANSGQKPRHRQRAGRRRAQAAPPALRSLQDVAEDLARVVS